MILGRYVAHNDPYNGLSLEDTENRHFSLDLRESAPELCIQKHEITHRPNATRDWMQSTICRIL